MCFEIELANVYVGLLSYWSVLLSGCVGVFLVVVFLVVWCILVLYFVFVLVFLIC